VDVLRRMVDAVRPGGLVLDLQVIRPDPVIEADGRQIGAVDGSPLFAMADAATAAVDELVARGELVEEAVDDHDVRKHYPSGAALAEDFAGKQRQILPASLPALLVAEGPCALRERCRLRRLAVRSSAAD
jgi:hypothetical protein